MDLHPALRGLDWLPSAADLSSPTPRSFRSLLSRIAVHTEVWSPIVRHDPVDRWFAPLLICSSVEVWLIGWWPGQSTPLHDHGGATGALTVLSGVLSEEAVSASGGLDPTRRTLAPGTTAIVDAGTIHRVGNTGPIRATSIHAYSPPGRELRTYADAPPVWRVTVHDEADTAARR